MVKKLIKLILECIATLIAILICVFPEKIFKFLLSSLLKKLSKYTDFYYTYHRRPKNFQDVHYANIFQEKDYSHIGVVIQGPVLDEDDFTLNTALLYKKLFKNIKIVISTWNDTKIDIVKKFHSHGIEVLLLDKPKVTGSHNINFQIISTLEGIKYFEQKNVQFVCKTRSDQRVYAANSFQYLEKLLSLYPSNSKIAKGRVVEPALSVCKYRVWSMTDMFQFGYLEDLRRMWDVPLDARMQTAQEYVTKRYTIFDMVSDNIAEIYIHRYYAKSSGLDDDISYEKYYMAIKDLFIVIDKEILDLYWHKYEAVEYGLAANPLYQQNQLLSRINHIDWLSLYYEKNKIEYNNFRDYLNKYEN